MPGRRLVLRHLTCSNTLMYLKMQARLVICTLLFAGCAHGTPELPRASANNSGFAVASLAAIKPALQAFVDSGKYAGIHAVIVRHGRIVYEDVVGYRDFEHRHQLKRDDVYRIYSMTKPVTAAGLMKLVDRGLVKLDDPVAKFIPAFNNLKVFAGGSADAPVLVDATSPMTIRQVLTHTSGLAYGTTSSPVDTIFNRGRMYSASMPLSAFADSLARMPLMFSPGTGWNYSSGIDLIGAVIEAAAKQPLDEFLSVEIFEPLKMKHTGFRKRGYLEKHLLPLYARNADRTVSLATNDALQAMFGRDARFFWGSGGLLSTVDDYLRFTQMLLNKGELDGVRVLSRASVEEMTRNQLPPSMTPLPNRPSYERGYGYGLAMSVLVDSSRATLPGPNGIYRWSGYVGTYFWNDPVNDMTAMVWSQLSPGRAYPLEQTFQRLVYAAMIK